MKIGGIPGLHEAAQTWKQEATGTQQTAMKPEQLDARMRDYILKACHDSLMHLGDLSRWRHAEKLDQKSDRSPKEAVGYYELAEIIIPRSGLPQHQLGVLAGNDGKAFRSIYHFYRSMSAPNPHPNAKSNLELEFKKATGWKTQDLIASCLPSSGNVALATLKAWFIILHAKLHAGAEFSGRAELEHEVIGRFSAIMVEKADISSTLRHLTQMNIAAEFLSRNRKGKCATNR